jgi:uncharacterized membrane protein
VASNWEKLGDSIKVLLLVGSTIGIHYAGYHFKYENQKYPRLGPVLILLSALFFGASLFLIAQIYNINANNSTLVLIWVIGVLPLVYGYMSAPVADSAHCSLHMGQPLYFERTELEKLISIWDLYLMFRHCGLFYGILHGLAEKIKYAEILLNL